MKIIKPIVAAIILLQSYPLAAEQQKRAYAGLMFGAGWYNLEGETDSDYALGFGGGYNASEQVSFEGAVLNQRVFGDQYYFFRLGTRYSFAKADFFMTPSLDLHGGALVPQGDKKDVDGIVGMGGMLLYRSRWDIEFGPAVSADAVFAGPHMAIWVNYSGVVRMRF